MGAGIWVGIGIVKKCILPFYFLFVSVLCRSGQGDRTKRKQKRSKKEVKPKDSGGGGCDRVFSGLKHWDHKRKGEEIMGRPQSRADPWVG